MSNITVLSSHGSLEVDAETGKVIEVCPENQEGSEHLSDIVRFDLKEWARYWNEELPGTIDILDLAYESRDGSVTVAEGDFRNEIRLEREKDDTRNPE